MGVAVTDFVAQPNKRGGIASFLAVKSSSKQSGISVKMAAESQSTTSQSSSAKREKSISDDSEEVIPPSKKQKNEEKHKKV